MSSVDPQEAMREIFALFRVEGREHVSRVTDLLLAWEKGELGDDGQEELFRAAHSLKGSASTLGVDDLAEIAHAMEDVFGALRRGELEYDAAVADEILAALDAIGDILDNAAPEAELDEAGARKMAARVRAVLDGGPKKKRRAAKKKSPAPDKDKGSGKPAGKEAAPAPEAETPVEAETRNGGTTFRRKAEDTVRLAVDKLDAVIDGFSEVWEEKFRNDEFLARLDRVAAATRVAAKMLDDALELYRRQGDAAGLFHQVERATAGLAAVDRDMRVLDFDFGAAGQRFELDLGSFGDELGRLRMAPLRELFRSLRRPVRDLAVRLGKNVRLEIVGEENELDKTVIELIKDPLIHILRNAVHHGIEDEETRKAAGKTPDGRVLISSTRIGSRLLIEVEDDGRGIDVERVKEAALRSGSIHGEAAEALTSDEAARLIFEPGISTLPEADQVSGRGVGLDIVATNVAALGGTFDVWSETGIGTRFTIQIPLTIATARGMLVEASGDKFIVPSSAIRRVELIASSDFETIEGKTALRYQGRVLAAGDLSRVLDLGGESGFGSRPTVLILTSPSGEAALVVSEVRGEGEFLTKDLGPAAPLLPYFGAAHVTGDGEVILILNADALIQEIVKGEIVFRPAAAPEPVVAKRTVLVVDDSLTTRVLEKNILEAAGYQVVVATDGEEALEVLGRETCDLAVVDVQMPRMDGYELTRRIRSSTEHRELPVVIVTSLDTERDVARGLDAGADAYIKKSAFDQRELLAVVEQFI
ncbi:MAG: hybrid sensor histidine kinase/response regulator [Candidatus Zixiibacteriota bacterium]